MQKIKRICMLALWGVLFSLHFVFMMAVAIMDITVTILLSTGDYWRDWLKRLRRNADKLQ